MWTHLTFCQAFRGDVIFVLLLWLHSVNQRLQIPVTIVCVLYWEQVCQAIFLSLSPSSSLDFPFVLCYALGRVGLFRPPSSISHVLLLDVCQPGGGGGVGWFVVCLDQQNAVKAMVSNFSAQTLRHLAISALSLLESRHHVNPSSIQLAEEARGGESDNNPPTTKTEIILDHPVSIQPPDC